MEKSSTCPIWGTPATAVSISATTVSIFSDPNDVAFNSPRTDGWYIADKSIAHKLGDFDERVKARLTSWLIDQRRLGKEMPRIDRVVVERISKQKDLSPTKRADRLLRAAKQNVSDIGEFVELRGSDYLWLAHSESINKSEVEYLARYLRHQQWLSHASGYRNEMVFHITVQGYAHLAELDAVSNESSRAFVAMWFDETMDSAWEEGIRPAIEEAGYYPIRIDRTEFTDRIDDQIIAEIRRSHFLVADFTHGEKGIRGSVYYEAGFAHGLNIPVFFSRHKDCSKETPFDTRQYNHIEWRTPEDLKTRLLSRICAVIGDGPLKA